jgi:predicted P-loop ATPase
VFLGSSNDLEFVDPTGNRRFWPFNVGAIDVAKIIADRDELWGEAVWLYRNGCEWWLPPKLEIIAATQQSGYVEADLWEEPLETWIDGNPDGQAFTLLQAMQSGLGFGSAATIPKPDQMRATACLKRLGYRRGPRKRIADGWVRYWIRPARPAPE